jgi:8-oxo-dGTP pyrophosphatase MutT (NUDIX family)
VKQKVLVYVIRDQPAERQVLVFTHRDFAEAGVQVPAGTVEPGEAPDAAAYRELVEESGLTAAQARLVRKLAEALEPEQEQNRHAYWFAPVTALPDHWAHCVAGAGEDRGMRFDYFWLPVSAGAQLAGGQGRFLHLAHH